MFKHSFSTLRIHVDSFELGVEVDGGGAHFAVAAGGVFAAAEGGLEFEAGGGVVDVDDAGFEAAGELEGAGEIFGGEAGGQAELRLVGDLDGVVEILGLDDGEDGTEDFFLGDAHVRSHIREDGGGEIEAVVELRPREAFAAGEEFGAFLLGEGDVVGDFFEEGFIEDGRDLGVGIEAVADAELGGAFDEFIQERVVDGFEKDCAGGGGAFVAGGPECADGEVGGGAVEVGIFEDDVGVFPAHFQADADEAVSALAGDGFADLDGAGEGNCLDAGIAGEWFADIGAVAGEEIEDAGGQAGFVEDFGDEECGEGGLFGGFEDDGVAAEEGGGRFPDGDGAGEIPGGDEGDRAEGNAEGVEEAIVHEGGDGGAGEEGILVGVEVEEADGAVDFALGFGDDFAFFLDEEGGGFIAAFLEELGGGFQVGAAFGGGGGGPFVEGIAGGVDGVLDIDGIGDLTLADNFGAMGGVVNWEGFGGDGGGPLAVDVVGIGFHGCSEKGHWQQAASGTRS